MNKEEASVRAIAWREPKSEEGYVYRIQVDGLSTRTEKKILRVCGEADWIHVAAFDCQGDWVQQLDEAMKQHHD